jgi:tetratricopeptide (TPR) repeat protein
MNGRRHRSKRVFVLLSWVVVVATVFQSLHLHAETMANSSYEARASAFATQKNWKQYSRVVASWIRRSPGSAKAWYHEGLMLNALNRPALPAFERAVELDPSLTVARQALCVELFKEGFLNESVVCAEHLPLNDIRDEFVAQTFQSPIFVGGVANWERIEGQSEPVAVYVQPQAPVRRNENAFVDSQAQDEMARREAKELANLVSLRDRCDALSHAAQSDRADTNASVVAKGVRAMGKIPLATAALRVCAQYDRVLKERQLYEAMRSQQQ